MRIERINENSIRCILSSFDLSIRNLNIKELAYGSEKARKLFNEMMQKANAEVGFDAENTPIMIEAIPMGGNSIQLIITKVDDPEELDTRFSKFSAAPPKSGAEDWIKKLTTEILEGADTLLSQIKADPSKLDSIKAKIPGGPEVNISVTDNRVSDNKISDNKASDNYEAPSYSQTFRAFAFDDLDQAITASKAAKLFKGYSTLYKRPDGSCYVLVIRSQILPDDDFAKVCNLIAEYGRKIKTTDNSLAYYEEHYTVISKDRAIQKLASI
ncbi:MAG: adaptor protein MecA [Eubacteriales bacterium]|nr:adaptor protein MecA [Eubacteriales bacterium]